VLDPIVSLSIMNANDDDIGGKTVVAGTLVKFKINTNIRLGSGRETSDYVPATRTNSSGYMNILVKSESGATYTSLQTTSGSVTLENQFIDASPYYWNGTWDTGKVIGGQRAYQSGTYLISVESNLNNMRENYRNAGATYTGKTVSSVVALTIGSDTLKLSSNKDSIVRGKPFAVTIFGRASGIYNIWVKNAPDYSPVINSNVAGVTVSSNNTFATVTLDTSGMRVVEFLTSSDTKDQKYTIRVESTTDTQVKSDEINVNVGKGGISLVASGSQNYYLGEEIKLTGTNTETDYTYLFITGPNLDVGVKLDATTSYVINNDSTSFTQAVVDGDDTYRYDWGTSNADLDSGTYTLYAVSLPVDRNHLQSAVYATVPVTIKKPFVSASPSQPSIAKGDAVFIEGHAEGNPPAGVAIWIFGKNYARRFVQSVDSDSTFTYEIKSGETNLMASGQYFIVIQHPMQNGVFDIVTDPSYLINGVDTWIKNLQLGTGGTHIFKISGSGSLQGSDAAEALIQAIGDVNIDDTFTKFVINIAEPLISIDPISNKRIGDKFTLSGKTNLAIDDELMIEVYSSSFKPTAKTQSGEFAGVTQMVKVVKSDSGLNAFSLDIDTSAFKVDEYIVTAQGITQGTTGTALFNIGIAESPTPVVINISPIATAPVIITVPPTAPPTVVPTPSPTPTKSPGYGALVALIGLGVVAFIVVRRE